MQEIRYGLGYDLDISLCANPKFTPNQMQQIISGLKKGLKNEDILKYADIKYDSGQMYQIRVGLENALDISLYADPNINHKEMEKIREKLEKEVKLGNKQDKQDKEISIKESLQNSSKLSNMKNSKKEVKNERSL